MELKPIRLFPILYDISPFVENQHPELHPMSSDYSKYWEDKEKKCLEGMWGLDSDGTNGGWRYMPPFLYYYINICKIVDEDEGGNATVVSSPLLRDVEWMLSYGWLTAKGFSGFEEDEEYTSHRIVKRIEAGDELTPKEKMYFEKYKKFFLKPDGTYKKYIEAREYLYLTHPKPLGKPLYQNENLNFFVLGSRGFGKMTLPEEPIRVKDGWTTMQEVQIGDEVIGSDGKPAKVVNKTELQLDLEMYKITLRDGREAVVCGDHLWKVWDKNKNKNRGLEKSVYSTVSTKEMYDHYYWNRIDSKHKAKYGEIKYTKEFRYALPTNKAIADSEKDLLLHPYILGCILGDGYIGKAYIELTTIDEEMVSKINSLLPEGFYLKKVSSKSYKFAHKSKPYKYILDYIPQELLDTRSETKFIPNDYLYNTIENKWALLQGLMDTDGYSSTNSIEYCTVSHRLKNDVMSLVRSLGYNCTSKKFKSGYKDSEKKYVRCKDRYRVSIYGDAEMFSLNRKKVYNITTSRHEKTFITKIEKLGRDKGYCIEVDNEDHTYLINNYIVTHNSFFCANAVIGHEFNFYGKRYFDESYLNNPSPVEIFVGSGLASKSSDLLDKFDLSQRYLHKNIGAWGDSTDFIPGYFYNNVSGSLKPNNADNAYRHEYKKKVGNKWTKAGTKTRIVHGVYTAENPQAAVGTRPTVMVIEEVGLLSKLLTVHGANETCQIRRTKFGSSFYIGTGGDIEKITEPKIVFMEPDKYNMVPYKDVFENRSGPIGFFMPSYYVNNIFKDKNGNTNLEESFAQEMFERNSRRKASNSSSYDEYIMARPIVPSEMFLSKSSNLFPVGLLRERLTDIEIHDLDIKVGESVGWLEYTNDKNDVRWVPDVTRSLMPIKELNLDIYKKNYLSGIVVYEHPPDNLPEASYSNNLYKVVYDPIKDDGEGTSLACILVYKGMPNRMQEGGFVNTIVAEYIGRSARVEDMHEIAIKLALYYNAKIMPETNISDFLRYCRMQKRWHLLQPTPWVSISKILKNPTKKFDVGVNMSNRELKVQSEQLLAQWLQTVITEDEDGNRTMNLHGLYTRRGLQELIHYDRDKGNWDYVSTLLILALWLAQEYDTEVDLTRGPDKRQQELVKHISNYNKHLNKVKNPYYAW